ncbi:hypothetical protein [Microbacterium sp.]|uniref:hypothetical protein n=1 Tax=Microbacterium sp. TaxID=51671 RepID=UPI002811BF1E|nr:hypothetical protein [Microbacterium sp.]
MLEIAGSLWSVPPAQQRASVERLAAAGLRRLHWDMTDGRFARAGGFTAARAAEIAGSGGLVSEAHIMATDSAGEVDPWTDFCDLVVVHAESDNWAEALDRVIRRGATPGLALSPGTPASAAPADVPVLCMSITPGQAGSTLDEAVFDKICALRDASPERRIGLDGGFQRQYVARAIEAGLDWAVVGTDLFLYDGESRWADVLGDSR